MTEHLPVAEFAFPGPLRDHLVAAIRAGEKTSTSSLLREYELEGVPLPRVGDRSAVIDSKGAAVFVIEVTRVSVVRLADVPLSHAIAEGEGHLSLVDWRAAHEIFWASDEFRTEIGDDVVLDDDSLIVLEEFRVSAG